MYKILIHIDTQSGDKWFYYQENGKDYVTDSLQEIKDTVLTLIDVYGEDYIKIVKQMSGQDMDNADVYLYNSTDNYEELDNRPSINGIEIIGQLSLEELGIQPAGNYTTEEQVQEMIADIKIPEVDFSGYATEEYVDSAIANIDIPETNLEGYATEEYVNEAIKAIDDNTIMVWLEKTTSSQVDAQIAIMQQVLPLLTSKNIIIQLYEKPAAQASYVDMIYRTYYWRPLIIEDINTYTGNLYWYGNAFSGINILNDMAYNSKVQPYLWIKVENGIITDITGLGGGSAQYQASTEIDLLTKRYNKSWTPTQDYNPVHKKYVDDAIAGIDVPEVDLTDYATTQYVDSAMPKIYRIEKENAAALQDAETVSIVNQWYQDYLLNKNSTIIINTKVRQNGWREQDFSLFAVTGTTLHFISTGASRASNLPNYYVAKGTMTITDGQVTAFDCGNYNSYISVEMLPNYDVLVTSSNVLTRTNTSSYTPTADYNPATKKYVDDAVANIDVPSVELDDYYNKTEIDDKLLTVDVNVEGLDIYSDEERVIGRWVDGRPLYQKYIYIGELHNGITDTHLDDYGIKAHEVRFHQVYKMGSDNILCLISPQFMSMAGTVIARVLLYQEESGFNVLRVATGEGIDIEGHIAYAILTYTKPDDEILLPTSDYYPATKKYVDNAVLGAGQVNHYICTASTSNPGFLNFAVTHVRPTSTRLLEIIEEGFTNIANGVNEGFVLDYSPNNNSVANWNNITIHTNYIKPDNFTQATSYELLAYTQRKAVIYLGVLTVNGTWSDNKFTCSSVEQPGAGAWTQFNFDLLLTKANTTEYTPTNDYNPATKKYVDDAVAGVSGGSGGGADLTNYYTKAEVDALLQELRNEFVSANNNINDKLETIIYGGE